MKPVKLTFKGIHSYIDSQTIDFTKIDGVFGIIGPTGAGKSTILDAICLALYNRIPRFSGTRFTDSFINPAVKEATTSFRFQLKGKDQINEYTVERSYKNDISDNMAKVKPANQRLIHHTKKQDIPIGEKTITAFDVQVEKLIGITYDDFVRTIILPQNQFDDFLLLTNKDRREALKRIFHLDLHGALNGRARAKENNLATEKELLERQKELLGNPSDSNIKEFEKQLEKLQEVLNKLEKDKITTISKKDVLTEILAFWEEKVAIEKEWQVLEEEKPTVMKQKKEFETAKLIAQIYPSFTKEEEYANNREHILKELLVTEKEKENKEKEWIVCKEEFFDFLKEKKELEIQWQKRINELEQASRLFDEITELQSKDKELYKALSSAKELEKNLFTQLETKAIEIEKETEAINVLKKESDALFIPVQTKRELEKAVQKEKELTQMAEEKKVIIKELDTLSVFYEEIKEEKDSIEKLKNKHESASQEQEKLRTEIDEMEKAHEKQMALANLKPYLEIGKPCPLCGEMHTTPHEKEEPPLIANEVLEKQALWEKNNQDLEKAYKELIVKQTECLADERNYTEKHKETKEKLEELQKKGKEKQEALLALCEEQGFVFFECEKTYETWQANEVLKEKTDILIKEKEKDLQALVVQQDKSKEKWQALMLEKEKNMVQKEENERILEEKRKEITNISEIKDFNPKKEIEKINDSLLAATNKEEHLQKKEERLNKEFNALKVSVATLADRKNTFDSLYENEKNIVDAFVKEKNICRKDIKSLYKDQEELENMEEKISTYDEKVKLIGGKLKELEDKTKDTNGKETKDMVQKLTLDLVDIEKNIKDTAKTIGVVESELKTEKEALEKLKALDTQWQVVDKELTIFSHLVSLFKADGFVDFVAMRQLSYITADASRRLLDMSNGQFKLVLREADFFVEDALSGGIHRNPATLSGGEKFLVSLCLALSLSARIQLSNGSMLEFFFLDEGFGSLDNEATTDALHALFELERQENMMVGLISHKESIVEALSHVIYVHPALSDGKGSQISM